MTETKICTVCGLPKDIEQFYRNSRPGGFDARCKPCFNSKLRAMRLTDDYRSRNRARMRARKSSENHLARWKQDSIRYREKYPGKRAAAMAVRTAISNGTLVRPDECERCRKIPPLMRNGRTSIQAHHEDYSAPLSVMWLCTVCHGARHREISSELSLTKPQEGRV